MSISTIDYNELAQTIVDWLDAPDLGFVITPMVGDYAYQPVQGKIKRKKPRTVSGTLVALPTDLTPILDYNVNTFEFVLSVISPEKIVLSVYNRIKDFVIYNNGSKFITDFPGLTTFEMPVITNLSQRPGAGSSVEIRTNITITVTGQNSNITTPFAIMSNDFTISLGYGTATGEIEPVTVLQGTFGNVVQSETANVRNDEFGTSTPIMQLLTGSMKIAYRNTPVLNKLVKDLFNKTLDTKYYLSVDAPPGVNMTSTEKHLLYQVPLVPSQLSLSIAQGAIAAIDINLTR